MQYSEIDTLHLSGNWALTRDAGGATHVAEARRHLSASQPSCLDLAGIGELDTAGAAAIASLLEAGSVPGRAMRVSGASQQHATLLGKVLDSTLISQAYVPPAPPRSLPFEKIGRRTVDVAGDLMDAAAMQGRLLNAVATIFRKKSGFRIASVVTQMDRMIFQAVPIVALITFLVGAIVTQQSIFQLRTFGASIFVVDLAGILMLREVGVLLTAIMIAGRSGSAITAELGSMRMREELDALKVMGLSPDVVLLLPRVVALCIGLPLVAFIASAAGLAGAAFVANVYADIPLSIFIDRLRDAVDIQTFAVGLIKAPFMAAIIGVIACLEGMKVEGSSESLGRHTTASVVKAIFMVIVADGIFAMFFAAIDF